MMEKTVSLIVATRGRTQELKRLLESLAVQTYQNFDVVIVDQNEDERVLPIIENYRQKVNLRHLRSATHGHAAANNVGLRVCEGDIIGFPDDDCWYAPDLLDRVIDIFDAHQEWQAISGSEAPTGSALTNQRFDQEPGPVALSNLWRRHISFSIFYRRRNLAGLFYDESLGIGAGTLWGSGEETEYLLQFMKRGYLVQYEPSLMVYHPDWGRGPYTLAAIAKARRYGMGMGRLLRTHEFPASLTLKYIVRPFLGGAYTMMRGNPRKAVYHWAIFFGRTAGWVLSSLWVYGRARASSVGLDAK
jgi:glycosyltransferase involved in cell wall biosynthesis